jgi:putative ATP-dependent endonuclease of OLD family
MDIRVLEKIHIHNYRVFEDLKLDFSDGLNVIVGDNDAGKTTLLEAVHLALTSRVHGRLLSGELTPHMVNQRATERYLTQLRGAEAASPPEILIDLYLRETEETAPLKGSNNATGEDAPGLRIRAAFSDDFAEEYERFILDPTLVTLVPTEYYTVEWVSFAGNMVTQRSVPGSAWLIDATTIRLQSGADYHLRQIISDHLEPAERVELARAYRSLREQFSQDAGIARINAKIGESQAELSEKELSLSIDVSPRSSWESSLVPHLDALPFQFIGSGEQTMLKILLALRRNTASADLVLIEEPENHQSPSSLTVLIGKIAEQCTDTQALVSTHSSFVINKLGLDRLLLLTPKAGMRLVDLSPDTLAYFKRLPGYDTLRVVLAERIVLVEGPSDELVLQRAYRDIHGKLPSEAGVDVISVARSFARFLDIADPLGKTVAVVTDNDGRAPEDVAASLASYTKGGKVKVHVSDPDAGRTLEPQLIAVNGIDRLNEILGTGHETDADLERYMTANKTACALAILETAAAVTMPSYIRDACT